VVDIAKNTRNSLVHHSDNSPPVEDGGVLHTLEWTLYYLVVLCLLREAGIPGDVIESVRHNDQFISVQDRVAQLRRSNGTA